jgi:hypothetical protein
MVADGVTDSEEANMQAVTTIGLDIAKSVFQVHGVDAHGNMIVRRQLKRRHVLAFFEKLYWQVRFVNDGGLMYYGPNLPRMFQQSAALMDKILKGAKPSDIPVQYAKDFELIITLKTAKALGITIPSTLLARADEVIE